MRHNDIIIRVCVYEFPGLECLQIERSRQSEIMISVCFVRVG